ncbi:MAG: dolichyl-phosphate beta-glucosyltransferase [Candidatus Dormibacteria bacterium]|nr:glycosyl transferase [Chloroflexota bacterium]HBV93747.1 glycosyl transferase [Chloroflexota bacterium]
MLSVIVPAFDEATRLPATLQALRVYLDGAGEEAEAYEVIVVDDGSRDGTAELAEQVAAGWPQLRVLRQLENRGKGAAVQAGMLAARGELRLFTDADLSTPITELAKLRPLIEGTTAVAIGSRALADSRVEVHQPLGRELMGRTYNRMLQLLVLPGLQDTQCGFKLFTGEAAVACFGPLRTAGFGFDAEVLQRARRLGWTIAEVGVVWRHAENSRVSPLRDSVGTLLDLIRLRLHRD